MPGPENTWLRGKSQRTHESCPVSEAPPFRRQARFFCFSEGTVLTWDFLGNRPNCPLGLANAGPARASTFHSPGPCWKIRRTQRTISQVMRLFLVSLKTRMSLVLFQKSYGKRKVRVCQVLLFKANFPKLQLPWLAPHHRLLWLMQGCHPASLVHKEKCWACTSYLCHKNCQPSLLLSHKRLANGGGERSSGYNFSQAWNISEHPYLVSLNLSSPFW